MSTSVYQLQYNNHPSELGKGCSLYRIKNVQLVRKILITKFRILHSTLLSICVTLVQAKKQIPNHSLNELPTRRLQKLAVMNWGLIVLISTWV